MPDIGQLTSDLRGIPDQALQSELQNPTGVVPSYLVLAEAQRRQLMRQAAQKQQSQGQSGSVLDDVVRNMMAAQPPQGGPPAPAGMTPPRTGPTPMPGAAPPQQMAMARGGAIRMADGGDTDEDEIDAAETDTGAPLGGWKGDTSQPIVEMPTTKPPGAMAPSNVDGWIQQYSDKYGVNPNLARAIMQQESGGKQSARSGKGAIGLFQIIPPTARDLGIDPHDPEQNVEGGIRYFRNMLDRYGNDVPTALAAYNAGPGAVDSHGGIPPFRETQNYVSAVQNRYNRLNASNAPASYNLPANPQQTAQDTGAQPPTPTPATPTPSSQQTGPPATGTADRAAPPAVPQGTPGLVAGIPGLDLPLGATPGADQGQPTDQGQPQQPVWSTTSHPGRIHQMIDEQQKVIDDIRDRIGKLPDPYGPENIAAMRKIAPSIYGVPPNYLDTLSQQADMRAATINQLQAQVLQRYQNPSPWEFLGNIAAGMGSSRSLSLPMMFGQGVGLAWQARDADQQRQMQDYDTLEKMREGIYNNVESERGRMGQTLAALLEHQAGVTENNRKILESQLNTAQGEQDKLKKMLVPTSKFEAFYNPEDYAKEDYDRAAAAVAATHKWNPNQMQMERAATQALAQRNTPYQVGGQYGSAYDQFMAMYPKEAQALDVKAAKYSPDDIASYAKTVNTAPDALYDAKVVPKDAVTAVRAYMNGNNMQVPVRPPNKTLHDMAAASGLTLQHVDRVAQFAQDPWMQQNVFGPVFGRWAKGEQKVGMDQLDPTALKNATPQQTRDTQDLLTSLNYLFMREGRSLFGGRPPQMLMQHLLETSPSANMSVNRFLGSIDGVRASANMAIKQDRDYMFNEQPISAVPAGARVAVDAGGRQVVQVAPGQPWHYMDSGEEYKAK